MRRRQFYFGLQVSFYKDRQGLKLTLKFRLFKFGRERTWVIRQDPEWGKGDPALTPKLPDPSSLAEMPEVTPIEPEDMNMPNFEKKPEGMSYAEWLRQKNIAISVKTNIHKDSGLPQEVISGLTGKTNELFDKNKSRQGKVIEPEDM